MRVRFVIGFLAFGLVMSPICSATPLRVLFMHHSTGANLTREGSVREGLAALGVELWDHGYNDEGLMNATGDAAGVSFDVPDDNTNPDGWAAVFSQTATTPPSNALSRMLEYDVIVFKSCFPASNITDAEMLAKYRTYYLSLRETVDRHPDRLFVAFTSPPLVPNETEPANAARAREWARYLTSAQFLGGRKNLVTFDFFSLLADADGMLRPEYRSDDWDSHPNRLANETVGPLLVGLIQRAIAAWRDTAG